MTVEKLIIDNIDTWTTALQTRSTAGRGSNGKTDLYGIKKLRELILELAVRGKLVPQNPDDEPASELLKRIAAEKAGLVKQGKIKKQKPLPEISEEEKPFELPEGWEWVRLGDIAEVIRGVTYGKSQSSEIKKDGMLPLLRANNIQSEILLEPLVYVDEELVSPEQYLRMGDVLIAMSSGSESLVGKAAQFFENGNYTFGAFCGVIRTYSKIVNEFIGFFLKTPLYREQTKSSGKGIGIKNLNKSNLEMLLVAMPSKKNCTQLLEETTFLLSLCDQLEQHSLTSLTAHQQLVETLLSTLTSSRDAGELAENWMRISEHFDTLFTTEDSIDALKQTILQLAVTGKLVPQNPDDEPASELLKRIAQEKMQLVKDGKIKKQKPLPPISDDEKPFELPDGWEWCRISDIAMFTTSGSRDWAKYYSESGGALFVTMSNLSKDSYDLRMDNRRYVTPPENGEGLRTRLEPFDLIISITGDVGNLGLIPENFGLAYINQHSCLLRFTPICRTYYFPELMRSPLAKFQFNAPQRGIKNSFRLSDVKTMVIPLPPYREQFFIAEKIRELMNICDNLKRGLQSAQQIQFHLADALTDAVIN